MRMLLAALALVMVCQVHGQEAEKKSKAKRSVAASEKAHRQPTKEQIRKFNDLEKKEQQKK